MIDQQEIGTLKQFYAVMARTRDLRFHFVQCILEGKRVKSAWSESLARALALLEKVPLENGRRVLLTSDRKKVEVDLTYEITELKKDIFYLEHPEEEFLQYLESFHPGFCKEVGDGARKLNGLHFNCFITDRDGTINNYCSRYRSSIQSAYNSIFLTRFARSRTARAVILTSAPLEGPGIADVSVNPEKTFVYAASKGREFLDRNQRRRTYPIEKRKQMRLDQLNDRLRDLVKKPRFEKFSLIGSGLQLKFGQTTIARQDISQSIPEEESEEFLKKIVSLVREIDPQEEDFKIEDTGLDIEIVLTTEDLRSGRKGFDKGDAVRYLDSELNLGLENGPHLICGDTSSDVPMIEASMEKTSDTWSVFVTKNNDLAQKVTALCPNAVIVTEPDILVGILGFLSEHREN